MPCVLSTDFRRTNFGDVNWTVTVMNQHRLLPMLLTSRVLLRQRTIMDANPRGGWTQRFQTAKVAFSVTKDHP